MSRPTMSAVRALFALTLVTAVSVGCASTGSKPDAQTLRRARSHLNLGIDYLRTGNEALAMRELREASSLDPKNARTHFAMAEAYLNLYGVATDAVLVNRVLPPEATGGYFARWAEREQLELAEIEQSFPVPQFQAPLLRSEPIGAAALSALATATFGDRDPSQYFTRSRPIRLTKRGEQTILEIELVNADSGDLF